MIPFPRIGVLAFLRAFVASFLALPEPALPRGLVVIEIMGHAKHTAYVRLVGGLYEVREVPATVPIGQHTPVRWYGSKAIFQIRELTADEWAALRKAEHERERPCRHCGRVLCLDKGRVEEDVHLLSSDGSGDTWCDRWIQLIARRVERGRKVQCIGDPMPHDVTCTECRAEYAETLERHEAERRAAAEEHANDPPPSADDIEELRDEGDTVASDEAPEASS